MVAIGSGWVTSWQVIAVGWVVKCWVTIPDALPEPQSAPAFFLASYPQVYPQAGQGVGITAQPAQPTPPVAELCRRGSVTPQQKIFAKVKAVIRL